MKLCVGSQRAPSTGRAAPAVTVPPAVRGLGSACPAVRHGVARGRVRLPPPDAYIAERAGPAEARQKFHVLSLLAESVELNALVQRFETLAGRSAMIGFFVASVAELAVPREGLFGSWAHFDAFATCAALLVASSAVLAVVSKRRLGQQLKGPVLDSLTAKLGSVAEGFDAKLSSSLDYIFDNSLGGLVNLDIDDFL